MPLVEGIENHEHRAQVRSVGAQHERHAGNPQNVGHALGAADDCVGAGHHFFGSLQRGGIGKLYNQQKVSLVLVRYEARGHAAEAPNGEVQQARVNKEHEHADSQQFSHRAGITVDGKGECLVEQFEKPAEKHVYNPGKRVAVLVACFSSTAEARG